MPASMVWVQRQTSALPSDPTIVKSAHERSSAARPPIPKRALAHPPKHPASSACSTSTEKLIFIHARKNSRAWFIACASRTTASPARCSTSRAFALPAAVGMSLPCLRVGCFVSRARSRCPVRIPLGQQACSSTYTAPPAPPHLYIAQAGSSVFKEGRKNAGRKGRARRRPRYRKKHRRRERVAERGRTAADVRQNHGRTQQ